jgi:hypothetical protein
VEVGRLQNIIPVNEIGEIYFYEIMYISIQYQILTESFLKNMIAPTYSLT